MKSLPLSRAAAEGVVYTVYNGRDAGMANGIVRLSIIKAHAKPSFSINAGSCPPTRVTCQLDTRVLRNEQAFPFLYKAMRARRRVGAGKSL